MSYRSGVRKRSENPDPDSGSYVDPNVLGEDWEESTPDALFLGMNDLPTINVPRAPWADTSTDREVQSNLSEDVESVGLPGALAERIRLLQEQIEMFRRGITKRKKLHRSVQAAVRTELRELDHLLRDVKVWSLGVSSSVDGRRTNLEREAIALKKAGWEEQLKHWRDIVWLEKELQNVIERYKLASAAHGLTGDAPDKDEK